MNSTWRPWTTKDIRTLKALWGNMTKAQIGQKMGRTKKAIELRAAALKLAPLDASMSYFYWSAEQRATKAERMKLTYKANREVINNKKE